jgi:hypothetical protein
MAGWAADPVTGKPANTVVVVSGQKVVTSLTPSVERPDVAQALGTVSSTSGFRFSGVVSDEGALSVYMLAEDGKLHPLNGSAQSGVVTVEFPDGRVLPTADSPFGYIDQINISERLVGQIEVPRGVNLTDYNLATMSAERGSLGNGSVVITDTGGQDGHDISALSVAGMGPDLAVRVGSCLQWQGYDPAKPLYLYQDGAVPVTNVTLSGVRD